MDKYFSKDELVYAKTKDDWFRKIKYYMENPKEREKIAEKAYKRVLKHHTYHSRARKIILLYKKFVKRKNGI